jgi:midasin (ATPase involved in ribosome maturation)
MEFYSTTHFLCISFSIPSSISHLNYICVLIRCWFPVLLEGSPGVGKTSLVTALGKYSGHRVVRINLSEQVSNNLSISFSVTILNKEGSVGI